MRTNRSATLDVVLAEYLRGQLLVMLVLAAYYTFGLTLAGLDRALAIAEYLHFYVAATRNALLYPSCPW